MTCWVIEDRARPWWSILNHHQTQKYFPLWTRCAAVAWRRPHVHFQICQILKPAQALIYTGFWSYSCARVNWAIRWVWRAQELFDASAPQQLEVHSGTVCTAKAAAARTRAVVKNQALGRTGASDLRLSLSWIGKQSGVRENGASDLYEHLGNHSIVGHSEGGGPAAGGGLWGATAGGHCKNCDCFSGCWDLSCSKWLKCVIFRPWYSPRYITKRDHLRWM